MKPPGRDSLLCFERACRGEGFRTIGGIDEAGRGPLAGPVVAACVVFDEGVFIDGVYDSKCVSQRERERLYELILKQAKAYGVGIKDNHTIDRVNILQATKLAMVEAVSNLSVSPDFLLTDAVKLPIPIPHKPIVKGDRKSFSIAAASIIAKVTRDRILRDLHREYPHYGWDKNKGYPTLFHRQAIEKHGLTPYHRRSFTCKSLVLPFFG